MESSVSSAPACRAVSSAHASSWLPTLRPRALGHHHLLPISPIHLAWQVKHRICKANHTHHLSIQLCQLITHIVVLQIGQIPAWNADDQIRPEQLADQRVGDLRIIGGGRSVQSGMLFLLLTE